VRLRGLVLTAALGSALAAGASAGDGHDPRVGSGPPQPGLRDAQSEPAIAVDVGAIARHVPQAKQPLAVGANDYFDQAICTNVCRFTDGVGISGVYFSGDNAVSWTKQGDLIYPGRTMRTEPARRGRIITVPRFAKKLASHGDPALAFGPVPGKKFDWSNGSRLYYATLALRYRSPDDGPQTIVVSRTDNLAVAASSGSNAWRAWTAPVRVSRKTRGDYFADKPAIWADNAESSDHFGSVYLCWASYKTAAEAEAGRGSPRPLLLSRSTDGGKVWSRPIPLSPGAGGSTRQGCAIRTDSEGSVYVVWEGSGSKVGNSIYLTRSDTGGASFPAAHPVASVVDVGATNTGLRSTLRARTFDGVLGARTNSWPSIDIANGAPSGKDARNTIVLAWADARAGRDKEQALLQYSRKRGDAWSKPVNAANRRPPSPYTLERPDFPAVAISPSGRHVYIVYTAFHDPWRSDTTNPRRMGGVMRVTTFADLMARGGSASWTELTPRPAVGDARFTASVSGEERSLTRGAAVEFIGDYNSIVATDRAGYAVWIDVRDTENCGPVRLFRSKILASPRRRFKQPNIRLRCPKEFGDANLFGGVLRPK
jgi:hypothetical protein